MRRTKANQKGKSRHFSTPEEIQSQMAKIDLEDEEGSSSEEESGSESDSSDEDQGKPKGVAGLIQIENPNRVVKKPNPASTEKVELSRREREEIEKQRAKERYQKLHAEGKTDQAKADLARLALIRQKREQEANKRKEEAKIKEEDSKKKLQQSSRKVDSSSSSRH